MEIIKRHLISAYRLIAEFFVSKSAFGGKYEINFRRMKIIGFPTLVVFFLVVLYLPDDSPQEFTSKTESPGTKQQATGSSSNDAGKKGDNSSDGLWAPPHQNFPTRAAANYNTAMVLTQKNGNAKTQLRAGIRVPLRILDKFVVSDSSVPILAESILSVSTESGLFLPAGTKFYGEASHQKDSDRAVIRFTQMSFPSGEIRPVSATALGKDSQPGVPGTVHSDAMKNTAGQMITTFVGGFAAGSMQTDFLGGSRGGVQNGILNAVATTAKDRAQDYGEKLKNERQWIEVPQFAECDAAFSESLNLQTGGDVHE